MNNHKFLWIFILFIAVNGVQAQKENTLKVAKKMNLEQKYEESLNLLSSYYIKHKSDLYAGWLYAHTLHLVGDYKASQKVYNRIIRLFPENNDLKLDRINKLAEAGEFYNAIILTKKIIKKLPKDYKFVAQRTLSKIYFWKGDFDQSLVEINKALDIYPTEKSALELKKQIILSRNNWVKVDLGYFTDDQPLTRFVPSVEAGFYINSMVSVGGIVDYPMYNFADSSYQSPWLKTFANFNLLDNKIGIKSELGFISFPSKENSITGKIEISKKLMKYFKMNVDAAYEPYLATTYTIQDKLMTTKLGVSLDWNNPDGFIGKVGFLENIFSSLDNSYYSASGWLVSPPLKVSKFELRGGYGINYSDSKNNGFKSKETIDEVVAKWDSTYVIPGDYNPIFTPNEQLIHSFVGMVAFKPTNTIGLGVDLNYGFIAGTNAPYLYVGSNDNEELEIVKDYNTSTYHPLDINAYINYKVSDKIAIKAYYKYQKTFYYQSNFAGIMSRISF